MAGQIAPSDSARPATTWRTWDAADGFVESYSSSVALVNGQAWVKHGALGPVDRLDGYSAPHFPDPQKGGELAAAPDGTVWMWAGDQLKRLVPNAARPAWENWKVDAVSAFGEQRGNFRTSWDIVSRASPQLRGTISVVGRDRDHALILLPDRILEFNATNAQTEPVLMLSQTDLSRLSGVSRGLDGGVIVTGRGGWGRLGQAPAGAWTWKALPRPPAAYLDFEYPLELPGEKIFLTGITPRREAEGLSFDPKSESWTELYRGRDGVVRAWPGADGAIWAQDGNHLLERVGGKWRAAENAGTLSGIILNIASESAGRFWVATAQGLAHSSPPLWQIPPDSPGIDDVVSAIAEDRAGSVWFLAAHSLIRLSDSTWTSWPLPKGETAWAIFSEGLQPLPDGRIAILVTAGHLLVFQPSQGKFRTVPNPESRTVRMVTSSPSAGVIVETVDSGSANPVLETFDGDSFHPLATSIIQRIPTLDMRSVRIASNGDLYMGGTSVFGIWHNGAFRAIRASDGFTDPGAFAIHLSPDGRIFAGGRDGLFEFRNSKWQRVQPGLDRVREMVTARDGTLWVASGTGVHRYRGGIWLTNAQDEGLPSGVAYSVFEDSRGRIWAGTTRGLSLFNPAADNDPPVVTLDDEQNPREAPPGGRILLNFSAIDKWKYTLASRLLFSWRLDGGPWSAFSPRNSAGLDRLSAGSHRFEVRAMDRNGNISPTTAIHAFSVMLPWYSTRGVRVIVSLAGTLTAFFFVLALLSYRQRGRLIHTLNEKNKLERDRQRILQMTASRAPLSLILPAIAHAVAENCPGSTCLLIADQKGVVEIHYNPKLAEEAVAVIRHVQAGRAKDVRQWRATIAEASRDRYAPDFLLVPLSQAAREVCGVAALLFEDPGAVPESAEWVLETFAGLAAGALENNLLYGQLAYQAKHDSLTTLPNRACFEEDLGALVKTGASFAILYVDLDRFKQINDTLGHRVGDIFLQEVALRFAAASAAGKLFRIGGDEFVVLAATTEPKAVERLAAGMLGALSSPVMAEDNHLFASASIGISFFPSDGDSPSVLLKYADIAMYRAKAKGRNRFEFFTPEMIAETEAALELENRLRAAIEANGLRLCYQPRFTPSGRNAGFEALVRLVHPERGLVDAAEFIQVAEDSGLIVPIGQWVLREACRQLAEWRSEGLEETLISVNVAAQEISRPDFAAEVKTVLGEFDIPPRMVQFELTESAIVANQGECARQMNLLHEVGIRLAIDDFGTGYSSFTYLQNLPVDILKIDRSFLRGVNGPGQLPPLMQAIVAVGRLLGLTLVAEGVETQEQLAAISSVLDEKCDYVQGYLLSRPLAAEAAREFLEPQFAKLARLGYALQPEPRIEPSASIASEQPAEVTS